MEQRTWKREHLNLDIEIRMWRPDGEEIIRCKTLDVSLGGAELQTFDITFPKHRVLEVFFPELRHYGLRQPRILGKFVRKTDKGMAIQFRKASNETITALYRMMKKDSYTGKKFRPYSLHATG